MKEKIKTKRQIALLRKRWRRQNKKVVFTNGCFDLVHAGHIRYLEAARKKGDLLIVGLNSDASVRRIRGRGRPLVPEQDRAEVLAGLWAVDYVVIFGEDDPGSLIAELLPDVLVKGSDWKTGQIIGADVVKAHGGKVARVPLYKGRSTSALIRRILKNTARQKPRTKKRP
jgi:rfaE bifunctional protein nucleotidyltransferase chain/domain